MILTDADIYKDIRQYQERINKATDALNSLPETVYGWQAERDLNRKRSLLLDEIEQLQRRIGYAKEALNED